MEDKKVTVKVLSAGVKVEANRPTITTVKRFVKNNIGLIVLTWLCTLISLGITLIIPGIIGYVISLTCSVISFVAGSYSIVRKEERTIRN